VPPLKIHGAAHAHEAKTEKLLKNNYEHETSETVLGKFIPAIYAGKDWKKRVFSMR